MNNGRGGSSMLPNEKLGLSVNTEGMRCLVEHV